MAKSNGRYSRHIILEGTAKTRRFRSPQGGGSPTAIPNRDRKCHGASLLSQIEYLRSQADDAHNAQKSAGLEEGFGLQIEFESFPEIHLAFERLNRERSGIELQNVRQNEKRTMATVFVPIGKLDVFESLIIQYMDESKDSKSGPKHGGLLNAISKIRMATIKALWTDDLEVFPISDEESFWWEVWLPIRESRSATTENFKKIARKQGLRIASGELEFPERTVLLAYGSVALMKESLTLLNSIAELRRAKETAEFFDALAPIDQSAWIDNLIERTKTPEEGTEAAHVCILDTGVNHNHPLLATVLSDVDVHTVDPNRGSHDSEGHGTEMAGLAMAGNLTEVLVSHDSVDIYHRLESVKLISANDTTGRDARLHGYLTKEAVARPEITAPRRRRVFSMAISARDNRDRGRPSAWSTEIDRLAADAHGHADTPRLFVICAGNAKADSWIDYPDSNKTDGIHDPAQSWNALTVGAATHLVRIDGEHSEDYQPLAPLGGLSPFSTTSLTWNKQWPLKPDVVFEGGNAAMTRAYANPYVEAMPSLSLLTSNSKTTERLLTTTNATSAASILVARMAAQLMVEYPELRPETIRALIVHSAEWTDAMRQGFLSDLKNPKKEDFADLVRCCGFGIPDLQRAMWSVRNSLTLICEDQLHPFWREGKKDPTLGEMNFHRLPWPLKELESLGETSVKMRVTLSYFIEPNPSERGAPRSLYCYQSHGLRYDVKRPAESEMEFRERVNLLERDKKGRKKTGDSDSGWIIGKNYRHRGSIHSDTWEGSAAELASRGMIGIYPTQGWWKTRPKHGYYDRAARYSLVVSILAPKVDVDIYSAVINQITASVMV